MVCSTPRTTPAKRQQLVERVLQSWRAARAHSVSEKSMSTSSCMTSDGLRLHYRIDGSEGAPWLLLSNSLGTNLDMWQPQMPALLPHFRVLRYDTRGHGLSDAGPGLSSIAELGRDVVALLDSLGIAKTRFLRFVDGRHDRYVAGRQSIRSVSHWLALCNTSPRIAPAEMWNARIAQVNAGGMRAIAANVINRWFTRNSKRARRPTSPVCGKCCWTLRLPVIWPAVLRCATWISAKASPPLRCRRW